MPDFADYARRAAACAPGAAPDFTVAQVARMIDHSLLRPELTVADVQSGCALAARYAVASVCVKPVDVPSAAAELAGSGVLVGTVVGFPHGGAVTAVKAAEAAAAVEQGAQELDMVINIGRLRGERTRRSQRTSRRWWRPRTGPWVKDHLRERLPDGRREDPGPAGCPSRPAPGSCRPPAASRCALRGQAARRAADARARSRRVGVKAAGGVRTLDVLLEFLAAGATRFGATTTAAMLDDLAVRLETGPVDAEAEAAAQLSAAVLRLSRRRRRVGGGLGSAGRGGAGGVAGLGEAAAWAGIGSRRSPRAARPPLEPVCTCAPLRTPAPAAAVRPCHPSEPEVCHRLGPLRGARRSWSGGIRCARPPGLVPPGPGAAGSSQGPKD